jgi:lipid-A-disaccharide synthase
MPARRSDLSLDLYITTNSPGEIAGWVAPAVREIRPRIWKCRITIVLLPCQYASGEEAELVSRTEADRCVRLGEFGEMLNEDKNGPSAARTMVLHMGGDLFFSVYLSKRLRCPLWAYASRPRWGRFVDRFLVPDTGAESLFALMNFPREKYELLGNLVLDSVVLGESEEEMRLALGLAPDEQVISCLTGSRPIEYREGIPFFARIAALITERFPDHRIVFPLAPTVREDELQETLKKNGISWMGDARVHAIDIGGGRWASLVRDRTLEIINCSRLSITVPGTNNLQAAALFVPFVMVLPLDRAEEFPLDGLMGVLPLWLPGFRRFKRAYIRKLNEKTEFVSLPNKMAGRMIAPEIRGTFTAQNAANVVIELLESPERLKGISRAFWELIHERGASVRLAELIAGFAKNRL